VKFEALSREGAVHEHVVGGARARLGHSCLRSSTIVRELLDLSGLRAVEVSAHAASFRPAASAAAR